MSVASASLLSPHRLVPDAKTGQTSQSTQAVRFGGLPIHSPVTPRRILEHLDFTAVGASPVKQIAVIFSSLITWRLLAANERRRASVSKRWNEMRENLLRDLLGFGFWFLGVPVLQRVYLDLATRNKPQLKGILIRHEKTQAAEIKGVLDWLKANNPLHNRYIPSSQQVKDQMHQTLGAMLRAGAQLGQDAYRKTEADYLNLVKHRNLATALGLGSTILLLGVGINLLNFWLTKRNVSQSDAPAPVQPTPVQPASSAFRNQVGVAQPWKSQFTTPGQLTPWIGVGPANWTSVSAPANPFAMAPQPFQTR